MREFKEKWDEISQGTSGWIVYIVLGIALALLLHGALRIALSTEYPVVTVKSGSMEPTLNVGDIVFTGGSNDYGPGDIVVFDGWRRTPIIHRIVAEVERNSDGVNIDRWRNFSQIPPEDLKGVGEKISVNSTVYVTKGDHNEICDQCSRKAFVNAEDIHGETLFRIPYIGWIKLGAVKLLAVFI